MKGQVEKLGRKIGVKGCGEGMRLKDGMKGWDKDWDKVWDQYLGLIVKEKLFSGRRLYQYKEDDF